LRIEVPPFADNGIVPKREQSAAGKCDLRERIPNLPNWEWHGNQTEVVPGWNLDIAKDYDKTIT
jgi:hypothetical protein